MNTEHHTIGSLTVEVRWKSIKNLHVGVYPPDGRVRVAAPMAVSLDAIKLAVLTRMTWVRRQQAKFAAQERQSVRRYQSGETHFLWGRSLRLEVVEWDKAIYRVSEQRGDRLSFQIPRESSFEQRAAWMANWRRSQLRKLAAPKVTLWSDILGVTPEKWGIRDMRTKWGSCNSRKSIIWLNSELSKKPTPSLDYVILHELAHLISSKHDDRFLAVLNEHMPRWRSIRAELNALPLAAWEDTSIPGPTR
ncbi:M48 family metallopeptidase [Rhizobium leguminosarum]|uniref:M48 family metallopeptidase n=1 Tax=Rhizobium leguminosarum TaxID=384 RepID=UPI00103A171D|nr:SprT family zinc-dependent metalloprotease [Rhizobium leguminosarum]TBY18814.1 M48 family peptidase [Rhizobium leguminosarum bv. viciae]TBY27034.1 M48 family peptidase [Rhizobium leguminosarum bv. viciae]TBZ02057.1 M48 family peptidase [Rhizobium leguminosarum bv. viciae]